MTLNQFMKKRLLNRHATWETAGLRAPAAKRGLLRVFSPQNPYIWPYLAWVSIEVAGLISDYLLLTMFGRGSSERVSYLLVRGSGI